MYTITRSSFLTLSHKTHQVLKGLPDHRLDFDGILPAFVNEGVPYPVTAVSIPAEPNASDLRLEFLQPDTPFESMHIMRQTYAEGINERLLRADTKDEAYDELKSLLLVLNTALARSVARRPDSVENIGAKLAALLHQGNRKGIVTFDWKSYDFENDIPVIHPYCTAVREKVDSVRINAYGTRLTVSTIVTHFDGPRLHSYPIDLVYRPEKADCYSEDDALDFDDTLRKQGIPDLLRDIYYELDESWEIGDFESDFLGIKD